MKTNYIKHCIVVLCMLMSVMGISQNNAIASTQQAVANTSIEQPDTLNPQLEANDAKADSIMRMYFRGYQYADNFYTAKKSGKWLIFGLTLAGSPIAGTIPALVTSVVHPSTRHMNIPESSFSKNPAYLKGYKDEAHDIKKRAIWQKYLAGGAPWMIVANLMIFF